jgi:hypothetical protein
MKVRENHLKIIFGCNLMQQNTGIWQRSVFFFRVLTTAKSHVIFSVFIVANFRHLVEKQGPKTWCQKVWQISEDFDISF